MAGLRNTYVDTCGFYSPLLPGPLNIDEGSAQCGTSTGRVSDGSIFSEPSRHPSDHPRSEAAADITSSKAHKVQFCSLPTEAVIGITGIGTPVVSPTEAVQGRIFSSDEEDFPDSQWRKNNRFSGIDTSDRDRRVKKRCKTTAMVGLDVPSPSSVILSPEAGDTASLPSLKQSPIWPHTTPKQVNEPPSEQTEMSRGLDRLDDGMDEHADTASSRVEHSSTLPVTSAELSKQCKNIPSATHSRWCVDPGHTGGMY